MIRVFAANKKKIMRVGIAMLLFMTAVVCCIYFGEKQIQYMAKKQVCRNVIKHEDELRDIVKKCPLEEALYYYERDNDYAYYKTVYYKDLEDENLNRIFRGFKLMSIDKDEDNNVEFNIRPTVAVVLWGDYGYGFYYTETDEPIDVVCGREVIETEFEIDTGDFIYWYRTERITENFWYYETKIEWYAVKR